MENGGPFVTIGYYSATLNEAQQNYDIYELELLAIAECLKHWRPYLAGSPHKIIVHTDHANLMYWRQPQKISRRIVRQVLEKSTISSCDMYQGRTTVVQTPALEDQTTIREPPTIKMSPYSLKNCSYEHSPHKTLKKTKKH